MEGKLETRVQDLMELVDPQESSPLCSVAYLSQGKLELASYRQRLTYLTKETHDFKEGLCAYLESGLEAKEDGLVKVKRGHWKCPNCPAVHRNRDKKCDVCGTWKPA